MSAISNKTLQDLEFPKVLEQLSGYCRTLPGKEMALSLSPFTNWDVLKMSLGQTMEYLLSITSVNHLPANEFDDIRESLKILKIDNTTLEPDSLKKILYICNTVKNQKGFLRKFRSYYPLLSEFADTVEEEAVIPQLIDKVIDRFGDIRDDASVKLLDIRRRIQQVRAKSNQGFEAALGTYQALDYLDEIRESVVENRRVLAVKAMYRKKVKGAVMGASRTGSIVYMEPDASVRFGRELQHLELDEEEEIRRILRELTAGLRPFAGLLQNYQDFLTGMDLTAAKAYYASEMNAVLPEITKEKILYLRDALHPLLYMANRLINKKTHPQTIDLHEGNRIIVISGPNAGGKSITLKTIGLLQVMLQSGLLIPVHERSCCSFFEQILSDIGDNQSIENHLSTYSYRLKNMQRFLKKCNDQTLFLIDEFGTGSDPELGGALAEAFLEVFYECGSYGVITTHYANLKALADELPHAANANMLFDRDTLEPAFKLILGEAGSSFTFEVAQKNGIPFSLINKARKKISQGKVRFDATIARLQEERSKMTATGSRLKEEEMKAREEATKLEALNSRIKSKLENYQELYDHNQRMIYLGNKMNLAAEKYFYDKKKRPLISELLRLVEQENSKRGKKSPQESREAMEKKAEVALEVEKEVKVIRKQKKVSGKGKLTSKDAAARPVFKIGDRVRLTDGKAVGSIDSLEKNKAIVNYGIFTTNVSVDQLELVAAAK